MEKIKVGIIGAGRIAKVHTLNIKGQLAQQVEIKAISDINYEFAKEWADEQSIPDVYEDHKKILEDDEIDAVLICSYTDTHAAIAIEAARAGKHIFCEKPVDLSVEKVKEVMKEVDKAGVKFQVGFNRRFDHNFMKIKELIDNGTVGELHSLKITSRDPEPPGKEYAEASGGIFLDMTIHDFDMVRYLTGSEVKEIFVMGDNFIDKTLKEVGDIDTAMITLRCEDGTICVIDNSRKAPYGYDQRVEVFGSKGQAQIENDAPSTATWSTEEGIFAEKPQYFFLERYMGSFAKELKCFVEAIINDEETPVNVIDGLKPIEIGLAAKKSYETGQPVKL